MVKILSILFLFTSISFAETMADAVEALNNHDTATAFRIYDKLCSEGGFDACGNLALMYESGNGAVRNTEKAIALYDKACSGGHSNSCVFLGMAYFYGTVLPQDNNTAITLFDKACGMKDVNGCMLIGTMYILGNGVAKDSERASDYFKRACLFGGGVACNHYVASKFDRFINR